MTFLVKIIGILIAGLGIAMIVYPSWLKKVTAFWKQGNNIYYAGVIRIAVGILILMAASTANSPMAAVALGLLFLASGSIIFLIGVEQDHKLLDFWDAQPEMVLRVMSVFPIIMGALIFFTV